MGTGWDISAAQTQRKRTYWGTCWVGQGKRFPAKGAGRWLAGHPQGECGRASPDSHTAQAGEKKSLTAGGHGASPLSRVSISKRARGYPIQGSAWRCINWQVPACGRRSPSPETGQRLPSPTASVAQRTPGVTHGGADSSPTAPEKLPSPGQEELTFPAPILEFCDLTNKGSPCPCLPPLAHVHL